MPSFTMTCTVGRPLNDPLTCAVQERRPLLRLLKKYKCLALSQLQASQCGPSVQPCQTWLKKSLIRSVMREKKKSGCVWRLVLLINPALSLRSHVFFSILDGHRLTTCPGSHAWRYILRACLLFVLLKY